MNKYRVDTCRLKWRDYGAIWLYFVTIKTNENNPYFGYVQNGIMCLNKLWSYTYNTWKNIPLFHPNISLEGFIVMPDHIHGIICINSKKNGIRKENSFWPQKKNLASLIISYKWMVTSYAKKNNLCFYWQRWYHDKIIRNEIQLHFANRYIYENPKKWTK